jgi:hypothetical protein
LEFAIEPNGRVVLIPATVDVSELKGMLAPAPRRLSLEQIDNVIRKRRHA